MSFLTWTTTDELGEGITHEASISERVPPACWIQPHETLEDSWQLRGRPDAGFEHPIICRDVETLKTVADLILVEHSLQGIHARDSQETEHAHP